MIKPLRIAAYAIFALGLLGLASCNRRACDSDCCSPSGSVCAPACAPCGSVNPPCGPSSGYNVAPRAVYPQPTQARGEEANPYYPCNPSFFPCGNAGAQPVGNGPMVGPGGAQITYPMGQRPMSVPTGGCGKCESTATCGSCISPPFPEAICFGRMRSYQTCDDCVVDLYQASPEFATVGSPYPIEIMITARKECAFVKVDQVLPCDAAFVKSEPETKLDQNNILHWEFPHMEQGQSQLIRVWVKPQKEGCCMASATICACPQLCSWTKCGQPVVCIKKTGPACACLYCPISYDINVCNTGSAVAYDVVVQDTIPDGMTHCSGQRTLNYELGSLGPGESRSLKVDLCAVKRGTVTNTSTVSYCGGPKCTAEATTVILYPCVEVSKVGPDWSYLCKPVDYTITVHNPGDMVLRNMVIDDVSPAGTTVVAAPGAEICCNRATWNVDQICPGETQTYTVTVCSQVPGCLTNKVTVTTQSDCGCCTECAEATTLWKGIAAPHMCMVDTCDPICVGQTTVYRVCVTNRGTAEDTNVKLVLNFSNELEVQSINGPTAGNVSGNTVTFAPIPTMAPKASCEFCVTVKATSSGNAKAEATLTSDSLPQPNTQTETTHVY